jgi:hypothetical protein
MHKRRGLSSPRLRGKRIELKAKARRLSEGFKSVVFIYVPGADGKHPPELIEKLVRAMMKKRTFRKIPSASTTRSIS